MGQNEDLISIGKNLKEASYKLMNLSTIEKEAGLKGIQMALLKEKDSILAANSLDVQNAQKNGMSESMLDRLTLTKKRIEQMAESINDVIAFPDPIGEVLGMWKRPNGLQIGKRRVPLGVVGIIYEARPNVTLDSAVLCFKAGNAVLLRGGSEAIHSNVAIVKIIRGALKEAGLPEDAVTILEDTSREMALEMMKLHSYIDVLIPRGGAGLIQTVVKNASIPVIETGVGNCHVFVDESADFKMAQDIIINAKTSRPSVCNSIENILIHASIARRFIPLIFESLLKNHVEIRCCPASLKIWEEASTSQSGVYPEKVGEAKEEDYYTEFNDLKIAVKIHKGIGEAIAHINQYGSRHSEAIITENHQASQRFLNEIDAAAVYINASTRFTDGSEFGFGAEIGISTQKLHARGPMGINELTSYKYIVYGNGQIR